MRREPPEHERHAIPRADLERRDRAEVLAADRDGCAQPQSVGAGNRGEPVLAPAHPRHDRAVVEAHDQFELHLRAAGESLHDAHETRLRRLHHEAVGDAHGAVGRRRARSRARSTAGGSAARFRPPRPVRAGSARARSCRARPRSMRHCRNGARTTSRSNHRARPVRPSVDHRAARSPPAVCSSTDHRNRGYRRTRTSCTRIDGVARGRRRDAARYAGDDTFRSRRRR